MKAVPPPPPDVGPELSLLVAARAGRPRAVEELFVRYAPVVYGMGYRLLGRHDEDLDDLVQDCFAQALGSLGRLDTPQAFVSWLRAIVVRTTAKLLKRRALRRRLGFGAAAPIDALDVVASDAPADVLLELRAIYARLTELPTNLRVALVLRRVEELPIEEIAALTGSSRATVKRRVAAAARLLGLEDETA